MPHAVTWFEISSNDPSSLASFYEEAFGWKVDPQMGMIHAEKDGDQQGIAGSFAEAQGGGGGVTVYVTCADIDAHLEKVKAAGGTPLMPRFDLPNAMGSIATFSDPEGNKIGLWAPQPSAKATEKPGKKAKKAARADEKAAKANEKAANDKPARAEKKPARPEKKAANDKPARADKKAAKKAAKADKKTAGADKKTARADKKAAKANKKAAQAAGGKKRKKK